MPPLIAEDNAKTLMLRLGTPTHAKDWLRAINSAYATGSDLLNRLALEMVAVTTPGRSETDKLDAQSDELMVSMLTVTA
jgi:hypothetical protein